MNKLLLIYIPKDILRYVLFPYIKSEYDCVIKEFELKYLNYNNVKKVIKYNKYPIIIFSYETCYKYY